MSFLRSAASLLAAALALSACSAEAGSGSTPSAAGLVQTKGCSKDSLKTVTDGKLTIAVNEPAYAPWFIDDDPGNGEGYEAGLGYRIAQHLDLAPSDVTWVREPFEKVVAPGAKKFDLALVEAQVTPQRQQAVDFSTPYYSVRQALITWNGSPIEGRTQLAELRTARLGAAAGTTSYEEINRHIKPTTAPTSYPSIGAAKDALAAHQIDGLVADLPTAQYLATSVLDDASVVGELPTAGDEKVGAVLPKGSALTQCVSAAVDQLRSDGTLDKLAEQWLSSKKTVPQLS